MEKYCVEKPTHNESAQELAVYVYWKLTYSLKYFLRKDYIILNSRRQEL